MDEMSAAGQMALTSLLARGLKHKKQKSGEPPARSKNPNKLQAQRGQARRNDPCPCGSGRKYKKCCGKPKPPPTNRLPAYANMTDYYSPNQQQEAKNFRRRYGFKPNPSQLKLYMEGDKARLHQLIAENIPEEAQAYVATLRELDMLVTDENRRLITEEESRKWVEVLQRHLHEQREREGESPGEPDSSGA